MRRIEKPVKTKMEENIKHRKPLKNNKRRNSNELTSLVLGQKETHIPVEYSPKVLETFANKNPGTVAWTTLICTEFTCVCPKTGQPDFAKIFINYIADEKMVESKSMKLYLFGFRNHGEFHEDCVQTICDDLNELLHPKYIEVVGEFAPRGGISIFPFASHSCKEPSYVELRKHRLHHYAPGKYSMPLSRIY